MLEDLIRIVGSTHVLDAEAASAAYPCPSQVRRTVRAVVRPGSVEQVQSIVRWAQAGNITLYPISSGRNWGYGGGMPVADGCVIVDLCRLNSIRAFDPELGLVTLEPGVSQQDLYDFIERGQYPFYIPVTGSSPACSLIGNALERGYGVTPITDHFLGVRSIVAVMPDGSLQNKLIADIPAARDDLTKWGSGPYLDGLFSQGNFGIVVAAKFALARKVSECTVIAVEAKNRAQFAAMADAAQRLKETHAAISSVKFFNQYFSVAMSEPFPHEDAQKQNFSVETWVKEKGKSLGTPEWLGLIFIHGSKRVCRATVADCKKTLGPHARKLRIAGDSLVSALRIAAPLIPPLGPLKGLRSQIESLSGIHRLMQGVPQEKFLQAAYWRAGTPHTPRDPGRDGCGLIWFAPFIPFSGDDIETLQAIAGKICAEHGFFPVFSLTTISNQGLTALLPILFDPARELEQAQACHRALFDACRAYGYVPYRAHLDAMTWYTGQKNSAFWNAVQRSRTGLDQAGILSPGRYDGLSAGGTSQ